ncbi:hypothetical protein [Bradyrhizobium sp. Arg816]|uniref:hypothetical protein n=1 Tax=Bradyrhizobium sp. Arg816 TaxID=2998491 RepID=UPI00249EE0D9|nr:hypothetical protein [Bradyrhizobium sp. Arg816]MDI3561285.1 hypothetical protein [Bradyrhizobium sp. Arg816]
MGLKRRDRERRAIVEVADALIAATINDRSTTDAAVFAQKYLGTFAVALGEACERHSLDAAGAQRVYDGVPAELSRRERAAAELADHFGR